MTLSDQPARDSIAKDLDITMMVEAAAGTGKTTSLVTRAVQLIGTGRCAVGSLAAITFTVKAAAQLRERLQEGLESGAAAASAGEERARIRSALDNLDRAFIGTTHAFCARMLRERPVESSIDPDFEELDEIATPLMTADFWSRWYEQQAIQGSHELRAVADAGVKTKLLRDAFYRLVEYADVEIVTTPCQRPDLQKAVDAVLKFLEECQPCFPDDSMRDAQDDFEKMMRSLARKSETSDLRDTLAQLAFLEAGNHATSKPVQKRWPDKKQAKQFGETYSNIVTTLVRPTLTKWREYVHCIVIGFLTPAVRAFEAERLRNGTLTFNDLLMRARDLLRDHPSVRRYFQKRFTHVLVDEFQDTDPIQAEVLFYLTGQDVEETNWRRLKPGDGSLFIVGDPKQSIYRFRRADITTYLTVKDRIADTGGKIVQLTANFRSVRPICEFVNATFPGLFTEDDVNAKLQAAHVDLEAQSDGVERAGMYVLETDIGTNDEVADGEARCIARWIRHAVESQMLVDDAGRQRPARYGDFLLVSDRKARLQFYAQALEAESIRYEVTGSEAFAKSDDLHNVMPLLRVVADTDDSVSLVAFLRGPFCGASDDALYRFTRSGGRFVAYREPPDDADPALSVGFAIIRDSLKFARDFPPAAAMARMFERVGLTASAATADHAGTRAGNTLLALALARRSSAGGSGFAEIVDELDKLLDEGSRTAIEELNVDPEAADVVRLMNLHQVKGLEAPVVFLIDPAESRDREPDLFVDRTGETSRGYVAIREQSYGNYKPRDIALPQGWEELAKKETEYRRAERNRLLYVAATRAKSILVAGVTLKQGLRGGVWKSLARTAKQLFKLDGGQRTFKLTPLGRRFEVARRDIEERHAVARAASYSVMPITKVAHNSHAELVRAEEGLGKGTSWGRVLHRLFEAMLRDESLDVRRFAANLLKDEERDAVDIEEVMRVVEAVQISDLWRRAKSADERYVEVPFALTVARRDVGLDEDGDTLLHGTIDLVFRERNHWFVVDYKSDSTKDRLDKLVSYYKPQVEHYARFWERLTGVGTSAGLFFVDGCVEKWS
ncbi:MAG TPA: UvrD-helicase domain-containing protein [Thermoanaerobaculia bacterium]